MIIAREGYYDDPQAKYFSINADVYACLSRVLEITVHGGGSVAAGTVVVADAEWSIDDGNRLEPRPAALER